MPQSHHAIITFLDGPGVDNSLPGGGNYPSQGPVYGGGRPDNSLPGLPPGAVQLPVFPWDPTVDNSLPTTPGGPSTMPIRPGAKFVIKWLACVGLILVPDNSLPGSGARPDNSLPNIPAYPGNELPPTGPTPK